MHFEVTAVRLEGEYLVGELERPQLIAKMLGRELVELDSIGRSSERVIVPMNGLISSGASVCPKKMLPAVERLSAPDVPIVRIISQPRPRTTPCITPRW